MSYSQLVEGLVNHIELSGWLTTTFVRKDFPSGATLLQAEMKFYQPSKKRDDWAFINLSYWLHDDGWRMAKYLGQFEIGQHVVVTGRLSVRPAKWRVFVSIVIEDIV